MASSLYDNLRKIAAAQATQQNRGQATAPPTPEAIKARALRLADAALADAERSTDPAARVKHLDAAERALKLAAMHPESQHDAGPPVFRVEFADPDDDAEDVALRAEPEGEGAQTH